MGACVKFTFISILLIAIGIGYLYNNLTYVPPIPKLESTWWGPGQSQQVDESVRPFSINVSKQILDDLSKRLGLTTKLTPPLEENHTRALENLQFQSFYYKENVMAQNRGLHVTLKFQSTSRSVMFSCVAQNVTSKRTFNTEYLKNVVDFWRTKYNWKEREAYLNTFPQFKTRIDGLDIHFIHAQPKKVTQGTQVLPLLLLHGWPGSVREFYEMIPMLTNPRKDTDFVFQVIAPSLPGYGFSEGASKPGLGPLQIAVIMKKLMNRLGFEKFYVQGGDWGSAIGSSISILYPDSVLGYHSNFCFPNSPWSNVKKIVGSVWPSLVVKEEVQDKVYPLGKVFSWLLQESGYMHIQATKPDTVGVALRDSPVGLAAYILEKFSSWTNPDWMSRQDGGLTEKFSMINLLDNIMIYWVTGSITTSARLYSEYFNKAQLAHNIERLPVLVPTACALFPNEIFYQPESLLKDTFKNLVKVSNLPRGGHFAAFEEPQLLADDIWESVDLIRRHKKSES